VTVCRWLTLSFSVLCLSHPVLVNAQQPDPAGQGPKDRPNVLLIIPDQLRAQAMGCMGLTDAWGFRPTSAPPVKP
jgi:hypothetical protein